MDASFYWELFLETGAPEAYLLYQTACRKENQNVSDNTGTGAAGGGVQ
ncbi:MAG: hypothetical protein ACI3VZ_09140 [Faecousia sp.]